MKHRKIFTLEDIEAASEYMENVLKRKSASATRDKNRSEFKEIQIKKALLKQYNNEYSHIRDDITTVFVSMSARCREENIDRVKQIADTIGFSRVITGFDDDVGDMHDGKLRPEVMFRILNSTSFLGIWGDDIELHVNNYTIPGVWMPLELGMAVTYNKPFALVFHETLERSYLSPVIEFRLEDYRDQRTFDISVEKALRRLYAKIDSDKD